MKELNENQKVNQMIELIEEVNMSSELLVLLAVAPIKDDFMNGDSAAIIECYEIFKELKSLHSVDFEVEPLKGLYEYLQDDSQEEVTIEIDGMEFRIIASSCIQDIHRAEFKDLVNGCYDLKLDELPSFLMVDIKWDESADYVADCDGYGHHFSSYDGSEIESNGHYIFRTN